MTGNHELDVDLYEEARNGRPRKLKSLIKLGGNVNYQNRSGWTALHNAALEGHLSCVKVLVEHQADIYLVNNTGGTALYCALLKGNVAIVDLLVKQGADIYAQYGGYTALHVASIKGHLRLSQHLIELGFGINIQGTNGKTPLDVARENLEDHHPVIHFLQAMHEKQTLSDRIERPGHHVISDLLHTDDGGLMM